MKEKRHSIKVSAPSDLETFNTALHNFGDKRKSDGSAYSLMEFIKLFEKGEIPEDGNRHNARIVEALERLRNGQIETLWKSGQLTIDAKNQIIREGNHRAAALYIYLKDIGETCVFDATEIVTEESDS